MSVDCRFIDMLHELDEIKRTRKDYQECRNYKNILKKFCTLYLDSNELCDIFLNTHHLQTIFSVYHNLMYINYLGCDDYTTCFAFMTHEHFVVYGNNQFYSINIRGVTY